MNALIEITRSFGGSLLLVLLNVVWQCSAIVLIAFAAIKLCRPRSPLTRHLVWLLVLVSMAVSPLITVTGLAGNLQLVQVPVAIDPYPDAVHASARGLIDEQNAAPFDPVAVARPGESDDAARRDASDALAGAATTDAAAPGASDDGSRRRATAGSGDPRGAGLASTAGSTWPGQMLRANWPALAMSVWVGGVLVFLLRFIVAQVAVWRLVRRSAPARSASLCRAFASARAMVGLKRDVALRVSSELAVPVATGLFRPCVLFPEQLVQRLAGSDLQAIALHELTHVKRMDPVVMALERLVQAVLFFHPAVWLASRALDAAREESCDEAVVWATRRPVSYARCLASLFEQVRALSHCRIASVGVAHYRSKLFKRVETILGGQMPLLGRLPRRVSATMIGLACVVLVLVGCTTFVQRQAADEPEPEPTTTTPAHEAQAGVVEATVTRALEPYRWVNDGGVPGASLRAFALCAANPDVLYAATSNGVYKSTDGAATWKPAAPVREDGARTRIADVAVDPANADVVYATAGRLYKSTDGGASWTLLEPKKDCRSILGIEVDAGEPNTLYAYESTEGLYRTTDGGETWHLCRTDLKRAWLRRFEADPHAARTLYAVTEDTVYITTDGAETWRVAALPFEVEHLKAIRASRTRNGILYAGTLHDVYYVSEDGGESWEPFYSVKGDPNAERTAAIQELRTLFCGLGGVTARDWRLNNSMGGRIVADPSNPHVVYRADSASASILKTDNFGSTWAAADKGIAVFESRGLACDGTTPGLVYASGASGVYRSTDGARTWDKISTTARHGAPLAIHPLDPRVLLVAGRFNQRCEISDDGGETWRRIEGIPETDVEAFVFDPENADTFYALSGDGVFATTDRGGTWRPTGGSIETSDRRYGLPVTNQTNAQIVYQVVNERRLFRSTDVGATWQPIDTPEIERNIRFVQVHPVDPKYVIVGERSGHLHVSHDAGETWQTVVVPRGPYDGASCIGFHPTNPDVFYLGFDNAENVLYTRDGGKTFKALHDGLPGLEVLQIVVSPADGAVYAATNGAGIYRLEVEEPSPEGEGGE